MSEQLEDVLILLNYNIIYHFINTQCKKKGCFRNRKSPTFLLQNQLLSGEFKNDTYLLN